MTIEEFNWESPPLGQQDQALVEAYQRIGVPLDSLAYTEKFLELVREAELNPNEMEDLRHTYRRLLGLRKRGLLPRLYAGASLSDETD
ncbi:MAG: hypothetical protein AAF800_03070 [Planctomycetota bacterium]